MPAEREWLIRGRLGVMVEVGMHRRGMSPEGGGILDMAKRVGDFLDTAKEVL